MQTIIYDSNCKFCTRFANWCTQKQKKIGKLSVRDVKAKALLKNFGIKFIDLQTIYFIDNQNVFVRSTAIFEILGYANYPWKAIRLLKHLPVRLTDYFYKLFAKYRYYF